jgi:GDP-L-fucose synthase
MFLLRNKKILLTGGNGFLGHFVSKKLLENGVKENNIFIPRTEECDLREKENCLKATKNIDIVIHLAGRVGGILFNKSHPAEIFYDNAAMALNIIDSAYKNHVEKFIGIGSVCEYPKFTPIPFEEKDLWNGYPEETNAPYGLAKKFMLVQSQDYRQQYGFDAIHILLLNLYGPGDNFDSQSSHVIPALIRKVDEAKKEGKNYIEVWGSGKATRGFLYVEDAAEGIIIAAEKYSKSEPLNLGTDFEISIKDLVNLICKLMDFKGEIRWDITKPDGQPKRCLNTSRAQKERLKRTIEWYKMKFNQN